VERHVYPRTVVSVSWHYKRLGLVYPMLASPLDSPFLIAPLIFANVYSASSLKQQSADRHVVPQTALGMINILIKCILYEMLT
jgi:hypothetical protein